VRSSASTMVITMLTHVNFKIVCCRCVPTWAICDTPSVAFYNFHRVTQRAALIFNFRMCECNRAAVAGVYSYSRLILPPSPTCEPCVVSGFSMLVTFIGSFYPALIHAIYDTPCAAFFRHLYNNVSIYTATACWSNIKHWEQKEWD
jgi:hypothetical protein